MKDLSYSAVKSNFLFICSSRVDRNRHYQDSVRGFKPHCGRVYFGHSFSECSAKFSLDSDDLSNSSNEEDTRFAVEEELFPSLVSWLPIDVFDQLLFDSQHFFSTFSGATSDFEMFFTDAA